MRAAEPLALCPRRRLPKAVADQYGKEIDRKKIQLNEAIKTAGTHEVSVKLHPKVSACLKSACCERLGGLCYAGNG